MADTKISDLSPASALDGSELFAIVQGSGDASLLLDDLAQFCDARAFCYLNADYTLASSTSSQKLFNTTTNGRLTLSETGLYRVRGMVYLTGMSGTSGNGSISIIGAGTATLGGQLMQAHGVDASAPTTAAARGGNFALGANSFTTNSVTAATGTAMAAEICGIFKCTATGTIIPSIALVTAAAAVVKAGSWIEFEKIAAASVYSRGGWD